VSRGECPRETAAYSARHITNRPTELVRIADALIAKETLAREEINQLLAQSSQSQAAAV
jgi:hypothetical protein